MFLGSHTPRLDDKGRLVLPARFRDELSGGLVVTQGQERCLYVFTLGDFTRMLDRVREAPVSDKPLRDYARMMFGTAHDEVPDRQGRITLPTPLRTYAGLDRDCTVVGVGERVEIWASPAWERFRAEHEDAFADQAEEVRPGVI